MANYFLVRHGATNWVEDQILQGSADIPLNKKGKIQAKEATQSLREWGAKEICELD